MNAVDHKARTLGIRPKSSTEGHVFFNPAPPASHGAATSTKLPHRATAGLTRRFFRRLRADGWSYGILEWVDLATGQRYCQLDSFWGNETRIGRVKVDDLAEILR